MKKRILLSFIFIMVNIYSLSSWSAEYMVVKIHSVNYHSSDGVAFDSIIGGIIFGFIDKAHVSSVDDRAYAMTSEESQTVKLGQSVSLDKTIMTILPTGSVSRKFAVQLDGSLMYNGQKLYALARGKLLSPIVSVNVKKESCSNGSWSHSIEKGKNLSIEYSCSIIELKNELSTGIPANG